MIRDIYLRSIGACKIADLRSWLNSHPGIGPYGGERMTTAHCSYQFTCDCSIELFLNKNEVLNSYSQILNILREDGVII